jgi:hypothetical protein
MYLLLIGFISSSLGHDASAFECAFDDSTKTTECTYLRSPIDTLHTLAIYCCGVDTLYSAPGYRLSVWQAGQTSVPEFFSQNSMDKYELSSDAILDSCYPVQHPTLNPGEEDCTGGGSDFVAGILEIVDPTVDFGDYDGDGDGTVDGFFFIIVGDYSTPRGCACLGDFSYSTDDTTEGGDTIVVSGQRGVEVRISPSTDRFKFIHICVHQWGHQFGLVDRHGGG